MRPRLLFLFALWSAEALALAQETSVVAGRVQDLKGAGIAAANVSVIATDSDETLARLVADGDGMFRLPAIAVARRIEVRAAATEHRCEGRTYLGLSRPQRVLVEVHDAVELHGALRDATGAPAPRAAVRLHTTGARVRTTVDGVTDERGDFTLANVPLGPAFVTARLGDESIVSSHLTVTRAEELQFEPAIRGTTRVEVRITGLPADSPRVRLSVVPIRPIQISSSPGQDPEWFLPPPLARPLLEPDGTWTANALPGARYWITPLAAGLTFFNSHGRASWGTGSGRPVEFECRTDAQLRTVRRARARGPDGRAIEGVKFVLTNRDRTIPATSDDDGGVVFAGPLVPGEPSTIHADDRHWIVEPTNPPPRAHYEPQLRTRESLREDADDVTELQLVAGCRVHGRVLDGDGRPAVGVPVQLPCRWSTSSAMRRSYRDLAETWTGGDGRFSFDGVVAIDAPVHVHVAGDSGSLVGGAMKLEEAGTVLDVGDLRLSPPAAIDGRVFGANGEPAPGTRVMSTPVSEADDEAEFRRAVETIADRDGAFRFSGLAPGAYRLEILDEPWGIAFAAPPAPLRLAAGETKQHTLRLPQR